MVGYIIKDLIAVMRYLPYGIVAGIVVAILLAAVNDRLCKRGRKPLPVASITCFFMYVVILMFITFLSRESGTIKGLDLEFLSTWGINDRNNAYVIENILLFIPYGFVCAWAIKSARKFYLCTLYGFLTSIVIETLQLITRRGFFQVDDILTNVAGTIVGYILFRCIWHEEKTGPQKTKFIYIFAAVLAVGAMVFGVIAFSSDSPQQSNELSMKVTRYLVGKTGEWLNLNMSSSDMASVIAFVHPVMRKVAHASEYAALAVVIGFGCQLLKRKRAGVVNFFYSVIICCGIAMMDEALQKYVFGRNGQWEDVVIDTLGAVMGGCIYVFLRNLFEFLLEGEE